MTTTRIIYRPIDEWPGRLRPPEERTTSPFSADWSSTIALLDHEIYHVTPSGKEEVVIQLALPRHAFRNDGGLRADARQPDHPGVVLSFESDYGPLRYSSDRYHGWGRRVGWRENVRAIALALEALRKVSRYGIGQGDEHYRGFGALPPGAPIAAGPAMTAEDAARLLATEARSETVDELVPLVLVDRMVREATYRQAAKLTHPDAGGDAERFRKVREARDLLEAAS